MFPSFSPTLSPFSIPKPYFFLQLFIHSLTGIILFHISIMYQYHNQLKSSANPATTIESSQLLSLFDKLSDSYPTSFPSTSDKSAIPEQVSAPASADVSPYMSEKECMEPENEDPESPSNFNSKRLVMIVFFMNFTAQLTHGLHFQ